MRGGATFWLIELKFGDNYNYWGAASSYDVARMSVDAAVEGARLDGMDAKRYRDRFLISEQTMETDVLGGLRR